MSSSTTPSSPVRVGLIGVGGICGFVHYPGLERIPGVDIAALADPSAELLEKRQREWEENQKQTQAVADRGMTDSTSGTGPGQSWDVHQYGYLGGDNQNRGGAGLGVGGARRQIIGPRPPP